MKRMTICLLLLLLTILSACGTAPSQDTQPSEPVPHPVTAATKPLDAGAAAEQTPQHQARIAVYYSDENLLELVQEEREISYRDDVEKYKKAIALLQTPAESGHNPLWRDFAYHAISFADGQLTIDTKGSNEYNLGASGEELALKALKNTLYQFPEVRKIVMLEDGQPIDSLMGHVLLEEALAK
jgi:hypothetical protein